MPPSPAWFFGRDAIRPLLRQVSVPGPGRHPSICTCRRVRTASRPTGSVWRQVEAKLPCEPFAIEVLRIEDGLIAELHYFRLPDLVERFAVAASA